MAWPSCSLWPATPLVGHMVWESWGCGEPSRWLGPGRLAGQRLVTQATSSKASIDFGGLAQACGSDCTWLSASQLCGSIVRWVGDWRHGLPLRYSLGQTQDGYCCHVFQGSEGASHSAHSHQDSLELRVSWIKLLDGMHLLLMCILLISKAPGCRSLAKGGGGGLVLHSAAGRGTVPVHKQLQPRQSLAVIRRSQHGKGLVCDLVIVRMVLRL